MSGRSHRTVLRLRRAHATLNDSTEVVTSQIGVMNTGDVVSISTFDGASGGTHNFVLSTKHVEFDS